MKKTVLFLVLFFVAFIVLNSCSKTSKRDSKETEIAIVTPSDYGNGVYYFAVNKKTFAVSLSAFIAGLDESLEIKAITGDGTWGNGIDKGYFVIVAKK